MRECGVPKLNGFRRARLGRDRADLCDVREECGARVVVVLGKRPIEARYASMPHSL